MSKHTGGCHCGAVKFKTDLDPMMVGKCNCERCRRLNGTFAVSAFYSENEISIKGNRVVQIDEIMHAFSPATYEGNDGEKSTESAEKRRKLSPKASWSTA